VLKLRQQTQAANAVLPLTSSAVFDPIASATFCHLSGIPTGNFSMALEQSATSSAVHRSSAAAAAAADAAAAAAADAAAALALADRATLICATAPSTLPVVHALAYSCE
jgi:hypothetical protein